jgi:hypothetical protein
MLSPFAWIPARKRGCTLLSYSRQAAVNVARVSLDSSIIQPVRTRYKNETFQLLKIFFVF